MEKHNVGSGKYKVFVTRKIPEVGINLLKKKYVVKVYPENRIIPRKELLAGVRWCDALLCLLTDKIDKEVIEANPQLKVISNYAVGFNNIDIKSASSKGIPVCNTPGVVTDAVAEHTFALILSLARRIIEADNFTKSGKYHGWDPFLFIGTELKGKTLGIVGLGKIGEGVAERAAKGMGMKVVYYDIRKNLKFEKEFNAKYFSLYKLLKEADVISIHVPLLPSTHHLIGRKELSLMKSSAFLINTSRGPVIDEKALVQALQQRKIRGAALDVYENEPKLAPGLARLKNVVLTPHTASATMEARSFMSELAARNIIDVLEGRKSPYIINKDMYNKTR